MKQQLTSFDGTESFEADIIRPDRYRKLFEALSGAGPAIARGSGLSYCAASGAPGVRSVLSSRFNRILDFDAVSGTITVEAGVTLGQLFRFTVPRGWLLPVMPGHPSITVGGCVAADVHGKNQSRDGNFSAVLEELSLYHPDRGELACSPRKEAGLFWLTVGGWGLTGFILSARLRLQPLSSTSVLLRRREVGGLVEAAEVMTEEAGRAHVLYSWHDLNGSRFGRGFVYSGSPIEGRKPPRELRHRALDAATRGSWRLPAFNAATTPLLLSAYSLLERCSPRERRLPLAKAVFPPLGKEFYFKLFGGPGLREYQVLIPAAYWAKACLKLESLLRACGAPITLASLKIFRGKGGALRFSGEGVCLALDAPEGPATRALWGRLDGWTQDHGGIVNIGKDSRISADFLRRVFPEYDLFRDDLSAFDPKRRFDSTLRRRLSV